MNDVYTSNIKAIVNIIHSLAEGKKRIHNSARAECISNKMSLCPFYFDSKSVTSKLFRKWCNCGVVSAIRATKTIDIIGFFGASYNVAMAAVVFLLVALAIVTVRELTFAYRAHEATKANME